MADEEEDWLTALKDGLRDLGVPEKDIKQIASKEWDEEISSMFPITTNEDAVHIDYSDGTSVDIDVPWEEDDDTK